MPRWLIYCFLTILCFGVWAVTFKPLQALDVSAGQSQALCTVGILPIMLVLAASPTWRMGGRKLRGSFWSFVAGVLVGVGNFAYFLAQAAGAKATTAVSLSMLYPAATVVLVQLRHERPLVGPTGPSGQSHLLPEIEEHDLAAVVAQIEANAVLVRAFDVGGSRAARTSGPFSAPHAVATQGPYSAPWFSVCGWVTGLVGSNYTQPSGRRAAATFFLPP